MDIWKNFFNILKNVASLVSKYVLHHEQKFFAHKFKNKLAFLIYNPKSGRQQEREVAIKNFIAMMEQKGFSVEARCTERAFHATELAKEAVDRQVDLVVANGGDGTLNEVLQTMVGSQVPLAVWPGGTANVVALDLRLPRNPKDIVDLISRNDSCYRIHVAKAGSRYYFFTAGIGLDAEIIEAVDSELKKQIYCCRVPLN